MTGRSTRVALAAVLVLSAFACASVTTVQVHPSVTPGSPTASTRPSPLLVTSTPFHRGEVGVVYDPVAMGAGGGTPPYRWAVSVGALPAGLTVSADGTVSGMPTAGGDFAFSIQVFDADGSTAGEPVSVQIAPALTVALIPACAAACSVEQGCVSVCGEFGTESGGTPPYSYKIVSGFVPGGMTLDGLSLAGSFPTIAKFWQFTASVTDAYGITATITPTFNVFVHISFPGGTIGGSPPTNDCPFKGCTMALPYMGGSGTPSAQVTVWNTPTTGCNSPPCTPPPIPNVAVSGGMVTITVAMPRGWSNGYTATMTVLLTDQNPCGAGANCSTVGTVTVIVTAG